MRIRVVGIIVQNGKLLLLKGRYKELWTPGGKIDLDESDEECLKRELKEEIGVKLTEITFFKEYSGDSFYQANEIMKQRVYIVSIEGEPKASAEIQDTIWITKEEFQQQKYPLIPITEKEIIPDLIEQGIF
ncbi:MAG: NUDIX domain-containing protein [bacterium]|nr:NUDIX domain-containing protein [bacterium]